MYVIAFVLQLCLVQWIGWLVCVQLFVLFVGRCCWGQDKFEIATSLGLSSRLLTFWISLVC